MVVPLNHPIFCWWFFHHKPSILAILGICMEPPDITGFSQLSVPNRRWILCEDGAKQCCSSISLAGHNWRPVGYQWTHHQFLGFTIKIRNYIMYCYYIYIAIYIYIYIHIITWLFGNKKTKNTILPTLVGYIPRSPPLLLPSPPPDVKFRVCSMIS